LILPFDPRSHTKSREARGRRRDYVLLLESVGQEYLLIREAMQCHTNSMSFFASLRAASRIIYPGSSATTSVH
jgi:hypothetical protein